MYPLTVYTMGGEKSSIITPLIARGYGNTQKNVRHFLQQLLKTTNVVGGDRVGVLCVYFLFARRDLHSYACIVGRNVGRNFNISGLWS